MGLLASYLYWIYFFLMSAIFSLLVAITCIFTAPFDPHRRLAHKVACLWGFQYILLNPFWKCDISGLENINPNGTYVLVANHQSFWDIMVLYGINRHFKWVAKESIMKIPFIGWNMQLNQYVSVAKVERSSIKKMLTECRNWLSSGSSIMIFPEGTRSLDGNIGEFSDGPFKLACGANVPVVPIVVDGTFDMTKKGSVKINFASKITVKVLPPLAPADFPGGAKAMRVETHQRMHEALAAIRNPHGEVLPPAHVASEL